MAEVTRAVLERMQVNKLDVQAQIALVNRMMKLLAEDTEPSLAVDEKAEQRNFHQKERGSYVLLFVR